MTTKQMLFSIALFGAINNTSLATEETQEDSVFDQGWSNEINGESIILSILGSSNNKLDHIEIIDKLWNNKFLDYGTISDIRSADDRANTKKEILLTISSNDAVNCGNKTIIINTKNISLCKKLHDSHASLASALNK